MKRQNKPIHQGACLNTDEYRLLQFYRMLDEGQREALMVQAGRQAKDRYHPRLSVFDYQQKATFEGEPHSQTTNQLEIFEYYSPALYYSYEWLAGGDEDWIFKPLEDADVDQFLRQVNERSDTTLSELSPEQARHMLERWKLDVMIAIRNQFLWAPTTADDAREQRVAVPQSVDGWIEFAVSIDGDAIAEELDLPYPGERHGVYPWKFDPSEEPDIAEIRLMLLHWYRRSMSKDGTHGPPSEAEIMTVLGWLRERLESPDDASDGKGKSTDE